MENPSKFKFPIQKPPLLPRPVRRVASAWTKTPAPRAGQRPRAPVEVWLEHPGGAGGNRAEGLGKSMEIVGNRRKIHENP